MKNEAIEQYGVNLNKILLPKQGSRRSYKTEESERKLK
jgi:hypothetical protein